MAMDGKTLGDAIADIILDESAPDSMKAKIKKMWESIGEAIVDHIKENAEITIPASQVIVAVTGQATGTKNPSPIETEVK